jgi:hypothetical protein
MSLSAELSGSGSVRRQNVNAAKLFLNLLYTLDGYRCYRSHGFVLWIRQARTETTMRQ